MRTQDEEDDKDRTTVSDGKDAKASSSASIGELIDGLPASKECVQALHC